MMHCISVKNMRDSDAYTIAHFIPSLELMHRAAYGVFLAVSWHGRIAIVTGSGNNGGDGFALACILRENGYDCRVFTCGRRFSTDSAHYAARAEVLGVPIQPFAPGCLNGCAIVVDCLLGTGFSGSVREDYRIAIEGINRSEAYVVSVDINSGMNGDTGEAEIAVHSDLTVTVGYLKHGLLAPPAGKYIKRLVCADIGIVLQRVERVVTEHDRPSWLDMTVILAKN